MYTKRKIMLAKLAYNIIYGCTRKTFPKNIDTNIDPMDYVLHGTKIRPKIFREAMETYEIDYKFIELKGDMVGIVRDMHKPVQTQEGFIAPEVTVGHKFTEGNKIYRLILAEFEHSEKEDSGLGWSGLYVSEGEKADARLILIALIDIMRSYRKLKYEENKKGGSNHE